jgi:hypothetical protein
MATYVPGAETYLPDIKPFTPDYKFLSAVLDTRQDRYNTNWKATNDLYNKVVYADLSRKDTKEQRDQYTNQLAPSLEKISGMDLSLAQNVDAAKSVFAPFFEDDLIVSDIMHTSNYKKEMDYANRLLGNADEALRKNYSEDGVRGLQYHMDDFINASPDQAIKMGLPKFVENVNIMEMSQKILGEMKPPLKMTVDHYGLNDDGSVNTDWIIREQNGNLVTGAALQYIQKALLADPRIQKHYKNQAFVRGRDFAAEGMANGMFATKEEGQAAWAEETISRIEKLNEYYIKKDSKAVAEAADVNVRWNNYKAENGIVPGSDDDKAMQGEMSSYEATKAALDARFKVQEISRTPVKDFEGTLNKAYNLLVHNNISREMQAAAQVYGSRDMEYTMKVNEYAKQQKQFQFDMAKIEQQHQNAVDLANVKGKIDYDLAVAEGKIVPVSPIQQVGGGGTASVGNATNAEFAVDEEGKPDSNTDMYLKLTQDYATARTTARDKQIDVATGILTFLNPAGDIDNSGKPTQKYSVNIGGENFTGSIDQIKTKLGEKTANGSYKYATDIDALYQQQSKILNDPKQMAKYPGKAKSQTYNDLYQKIYSDQGINTELEVIDKTFNTVAGKYKKSHDAAIVLVKGEDSDVKALMERGGMPGIYQTSSSGVVTAMTKEQYIAKVAELAKQGKVKNINLDWTWDTGTNDPGYLIDEKKWVGSPRTYSGGTGGGGGGNWQYTGKKVLDMTAINAEAGLVYDKIKQKTNEALTGKLGNKFETGTFKGTMNGRTGATDMGIAPVYRAPVDPLASTLEGQTTLAQMMTQKNMLDGQGGGYTMVLGNLSDKKDKASIINDPLALKAYNAYVADMLTWTGNKKRSNTAGIAPRASITYSGTLGAAGEGKKTTAGYTIDGFNEWLASKVKGSETEASGPEGEYGLFTKDEVAQLKNGISMVFDKKQDINPRSGRNQYYSKTLSAIEASPEKFVQYDYPGVDGMTPTARYRIVKTGTDQYYATYQYSTYQPDGTYRTSDWQQTPILVGSFNAAESIDAQVKKMQETFEIQRQLNLEDYNKNSAAKGKKK